ncbi:MAG: hypothetical protein EAZ06_04755 [Cytophagales bacterium]|nr:MAG: hypothetical protein EAY69_08170 [Cytophagales bacterium]TAH30023.1 MAG: hypothetical protein EAZ06_04755 [Cytophagales bacterium]
MKTSFYLKNWLFYFFIFPSFLSAQNNFFEHFSIVNLPYRASSYTLWKDTISSQYVVERIFEKANKKGIPTFQDFWREESKQMTIDALEAKYINVEKKQYAALNAGYGVILPYSSHFRTIIFHLSPLLMEGSYDYSYIVTFDFDNNMIDALQIAAKAGYVDVQTESESLIGRNGKITTQQTIKKYEKISIDNVPDLVENADFVYQIDNKSGKIQLISQNYSGFSGNFVNNNEKWQLLHSPTQLKILYEVTFNNTLQELEVIFYDREKGEIIAQNNQKQQYHLQFNPKKTHFTYSYQNKNIFLERVED